VRRSCRKGKIEPQGGAHEHSGQAVSSRGHSEKSAPGSEQVSDAIERIARLSPQLRLAERYQERLAAAVRTSLDYVGALVDDMRPAREASASAWTTDPYIQAFFAAPEDVPRALSRSTELRTHFDANPVANEAFAVLGMAMTERRTFGVAQHGSTACTDVQRTTVSFSGHRARVCASTERTLREEIVLRVVDQLVLVGLERIGVDVSRRDEVEQERALLKTRLAAAAAAGQRDERRTGCGAIVRSRGAGAPSRADGRKRRGAGASGTRDRGDRPPAGSLLMCSIRPRNTCMYSRGNCGSIA